MKRTHVLFVCSRNKWRSPTAEQIFRDDARLAVRSCGLSRQAVRKISAKDLQWADIVFVMEAEHRKRILDRFRDLLLAASIHVLDIPDEYQYMDPELIDLLQERVGWHLRELEES